MVTYRPPVGNVTCCMMFQASGSLICEELALPPPEAVTTSFQVPRGLKSARVKRMTIGAGNNWPAPTTADAAQLTLPWAAVQFQPLAGGVGEPPRLPPQPPAPAQQPSVA